MRRISVNEADQRGPMFADHLFAILRRLACPLSGPFQRLLCHVHDVIRKR